MDFRVLFVVSFYVGFMDIRLVMLYFENLRISNMIYLRNCDDVFKVIGVGSLLIVDEW